MRKPRPDPIATIAALVQATTDPKERLQRLRRVRALGDNPDKNQLVNLITEFEFGGQILPLTRRKAQAPQEVPAFEPIASDYFEKDSVRLARAAAKRLRKAKNRTTLIPSNSN